VLSLQSVTQEWHHVFTAEYPLGLEESLFASDVDISDNYAIVGAREEPGDSTPVHKVGAAYIYKRIGEVWQLQQRLAPLVQTSDLHFGRVVKIKDDFAVVGRVGRDVYVYKNTGNEWILSQVLNAPDQEESPWFLPAIAISENYLLIGSHYDDLDENGQNDIHWAGSAYIFKINNGVWEFAQKICASDRIGGQFYGSAVDITDQYAVVGTIYESRDENGANLLNHAGAAYLYTNTNGDWSQVQKIVASDRSSNANFGNNVTLYGSTVVIGSGKNYQSYVFDYFDDSWTETQLIVPDAPSIGWGSSLVSLHKDKLLINIYGTNELHLFFRSAGNWGLSQVIYPPGIEGLQFRSRCSLSAYNIIVSGRVHVEEDLALFYFDGHASSVEDHKQNLFSFSPNPVTNTLLISIPETYTNECRLKIYNESGKLVSSEEIKSIESQIEMHNFSPGIYIIEASIGNRKHCEKIIKR